MQRGVCPSFIIILIANFFLFSFFVAKSKKNNLLDFHVGTSSTRNDSFIPSSFFSVNALHMRALKKQLHIMGSRSFSLPSSKAANGVDRRLAVHTALSLGSEMPPTWPLPLPPPFSRNKNKQVLLLDIDETLIHTFGMTSGPISKQDLDEEMNKKIENDEALLAGIRLENFHYVARPYLREFLTEVNDLFEVIFWTSGVSSYCAAIVDSFERDILQLPPSFYSFREILKEIKGISGESGSTNRANFYALSRSQTLEKLNYMKYIPMINRPHNSAVLIDDNERSFPLTPRSGLKIAPFSPTSESAVHYLCAAQKLQNLRRQSKPIDAKLARFVEDGNADISRMEADTALLDILPMLRAIASVPYGQDVRRELDHWRKSSYTDCDDFHQNMDLRSVARRELLGTFTATRQPEPIPPLKSHLYNSSFIEECCAEIALLHRRSINRSKL